MQDLADTLHPSIFLISVCVTLCETAAQKVRTGNTSTSATEPRRRTRGKLRLPQPATYRETGELLTA
jgi:hypothetical protein